MLEAKNVQFTYLGAKYSVIKNINLTIASKTLIRITGDNGNGKTTLALALSGIIPQIIKGNLAGRVSWNDQSLSHKNLSELVSFVFQDPYIYFSGYTVEEERYFISDIFEDFLPKVSNRTALHKLSSGEQQRIAIASALSRKNPLIILDEPFEYLDKEARKKASQLLLEKLSRNDCLIIVIDRDESDTSVNYDIVIKVENGYISQVAGETQVHSIPKVLPLLESETTLEVENLSYSYPYNDLQLINNASFSVKKGESVGIVGSNGCGKTTLLLLLAGLIKAQKGKFRFKGKQINRTFLRKTSKIVFPNPETQIFSNSIQEELEFGMRNSNFEESEIQKQLEEAKHYLSFDFNTDPFSLSFGQKKILSIMATFLMKPKLILLDEPSASLDGANLVKVSQLLNDFLAKGNSVIMASHDEIVLEKLCHRTVKMIDGNLVS